MSGVTGIFNLNGEPVSPILLRAMTNELMHRGPDSEGYYADSFIGLGHRRLSIIDLAPSGHQPMGTSDGRFVISYNGEIYNYEDLKLELKALGRAFVSRSDTEVLLHAWVEWGPACLDRLNGMFAFAIWDKANCELVLARDRYGIKPLYYVLTGRHLLFASEVKAFLAHRSFTPEIDCEGLAEYLTFPNYFSDRTLFRGVRMLPAGCYMRIALSAQSMPEPIRYWDYSFGGPNGDASELETVERLEQLFRQAVSRQLVSDVPVNAYLSAVAAGDLAHLKTFTVGFVH
jgi:asparagine synthase (glutamine-hydrolysing)